MLRIDQYSLNRFLGKGTFGEVYLTQKDGSMNYYATKRMERAIFADGSEQLKKLTKEINLNQKQLVNLINIKYILLVVLMQICIAGLSISFGLFINYVLDLCVISGNIKTLLIVCFSFAIISLLKYLFNYLLTLYNSHYLKEEYFFYKDKIFKHLFNKKINFFQK